MINGLDDLQKVGKDNFDVAVKSADAFTKGFGVLATETADYARHSLETGAKAFEKLVAAPSLDKAVEVQADYLRSAYEGYVEPGDQGRRDHHGYGPRCLQALRGRVLGKIAAS